MSYPLAPIPQNKIEEHFMWRDWFTKIGNYVRNLGTMSAQNSSSVSITGGTISGVLITGVPTQLVYNYQTPITGFSITFPDNTDVLVLNPAAKLASGTITFPATPLDGQEICITTTQVITTLTLNGNTGQTIILPTLSTMGTGKWIYRTTNKTWYRTA